MPPREIRNPFYLNPDELLNKRSELVSKCRHAKKILLANYKANNYITQSALVSEWNSAVVGSNLKIFQW